MSDRSSRRDAPRVNGLLARHLEGWQAGVLAVFIAGSVAALVVPRPVDPEDIPEPRLDRRALSKTELNDDALAAAAARDGLDPDVKALGSAFREYGRADADVSHEDKTSARERVIHAAGNALAQGVPAIAKLRAYQLHAFVRAVRVWESTGKETDDLVELGGGFVQAMKRGAHLEGRHVVMDEDALRASFKKRWHEITGIEAPELAITLEEQLAIYRFVLAHPPLPPDADVPAAALHVFADNYRLKKLEELARLDKSYPIDLGRGVLHYRLGKYPLALEDFRRYLDANPDGPFTLRAQNYLRAALGRARSEQE